MTVVRRIVQEGGRCMPESVQSWWARRQWSKGDPSPYPIGTYRGDWERYPVLVRQYHPDLNHGITLTQIPPAAEVYLVWQCDAGHRFVATPEEQRQRPGSSRRRSTWCPDCAALAVDRTSPTPRRSIPGLDAPAMAEPEVAAPAPYSCGHPRDLRRIVAAATAHDAAPGEHVAGADRCALCERLDSGTLTRDELLAAVSPTRREQLALETNPSRRYPWVCPVGHGVYEAQIERMLQGRRCPVCTHARGGADLVAPGGAFLSEWAPKPASAAEGSLRHRLAQALDVDLGNNAVRVARPFFRHIEVWPDIVIPELQVAIEYDTTGRDGLEHVGRREDTDRRKDRLLRGVGWEVVRIRCGKLQPIGPHDLVAAGVSAKLIDRLVEELCVIRGDLIVRSYLR
jgi:hypothetical protein